MNKRQKLKARGKVTQKLTRDGLIERNAATGEDVRISKRLADFDLRGKTPGETLSQFETRRNGNGKQIGKQIGNHKKRAVYREAAARSKQSTDICEAEQSSPLQFGAAKAVKKRDDNRTADEVMNQDIDGAVDEAVNQNAAQPDTERPAEGKTAETPRESGHSPPQNNLNELRRIPGANNKPPPNIKPQYRLSNERPKSQLQTEKPGRLQFEHNEPAESPPQGKANTRRARDAPKNAEETKTHEYASNGEIDSDSQKEIAEQSAADCLPIEDKPSQQQFDSAEPTQTPTDKPKHNKSAEDAAKPETKTEAPIKSDRTIKLQFSSDETSEVTFEPPISTRNKKLAKAQKQAEIAVMKLEKSKVKLPAKKKLRSDRVFNEETGKPKRVLYFESEIKSQGEHLKGAKPLRPVKLAGNTALAFGHRKMFQAERENVAAEAAHKGEMAAEGIVRSVLRHHKLAPYRRASKLERTAAKKSVNLAYQKALAENPKLQSNIISRVLQKRKIKKDYAKAARSKVNSRFAQKAAKRAKKAGSAAGNAAKAIGGAIKRHPAAAATIAIILLLLFALMSLVGAFGSMGSGGIAGIGASSYLSSDTDILVAEAAYTAMEAELQNKLDNYESLNPGCDEYVYNLDAIWHDPYVLTSILSALHEGAWTFDEVHDTLAMLFERQYILTEETAAEERYRSETRIETNPETGLTYEVSVQVPYNYYIRTVTLENFDLSHLPIYIMSETELSRYALYTATLGNRPDIFPVSLYPKASYYKDYGRHEIPEEYFADSTFAAIIAEAEKYCGMPYVWGGYSPKTSFDCSGFVSYVLNQCGWDIGRLGAQGLYDICSPISAPEAKPGDLIFFHSTYDAPGITHVGIYVGDEMMLSCGDPIGYDSVGTSYWQTHLFGYGRVY
jgi:hypothetical protein